MKVKVLLSPASLDAPGAIFPELSVHRVKDTSRIVLPTDVGSYRGLPYVVSAFMFGETLEARLERGPLALLDALKVCSEVGLALQAVANARFAHRDVKPANIFLCSDGQVKLFDFGLARERATVAPGGEGTLGFMPPEQAHEGIVDSRSDVFSLTLVLFTCLFGSALPPARSSAAELQTLIRNLRAPRSVRNLLRAGTHADIEQRPRIAEWLTVVSPLLAPWSNIRVAMVAATAAFILAAILGALISSPELQTAVLLSHGLTSDPQPSGSRAPHAPPQQRKSVP